MPSVDRAPREGAPIDLEGLYSDGPEQRVIEEDLVAFVDSNNATDQTRINAIYESSPVLCIACTIANDEGRLVEEVLPEEILRRYQQGGLPDSQTGASPRIVVGEYLQAVGLL